MKQPFRVIGISGAAGAGKDTAAMFLAMEYDYKILHFAAPMKRGLNAMFGWTMEQWDNREWKETVLPDIGKSPRQLAQTIGTEWGRNLVNLDLWLLLALRDCRVAQERGYPGAVFADCRFENEADLIQKNCGHVIHLARPDVAAVAAHSSEAGLPSHLVDLQIVNDRSKEALYDALGDFIRTLD